jgi:hypothetical protein
MKIGITNSLGIEPSVGFHQLKLTYTNPSSEWDPTYGTYIETENKEEIRYNVFLVSNMFDIKPIRREKSNFLIRLGAGYWRAMVSEESEDSFSELEGSEEYEDVIWNVSAKLGFGIEHFFNDHFSVYAGFLNSWGIYGTDQKEGDPATVLSLGNQLAELSFVWYLQ